MQVTIDNETYDIICIPALTPNHEILFRETLHNLQLLIADNTIHFVPNQELIDDMAAGRNKSSPDPITSDLIEP
jgi:hypothetical protein